MSYLWVQTRVPVVPLRAVPRQPVSVVPALMIRVIWARGGTLTEVLAALSTIPRLCPETVVPVYREVKA